MATKNLNTIIGMDATALGSRLSDLDAKTGAEAFRNITSGTAVTASGAGYETFNQYVPGQEVTAARQGVEVSESKVGDPITITKSVTTGSSALYGAYIRIPYSDLTDLDRVLQLNAKVLSGQPFTYIRILRTPSDWNPANNPVYLSDQEVDEMREGGAGLNLRDVLTASIYTSEYAAQDHLYMIVGDSDPTSSNNDAKTGVWSIQPQFESDRDVVANKLSPGLQSQIPGIEDLATLTLPKARMDQIAAHQRVGDQSEASVDQTHDYAFSDGAATVGYTATLFNDSSEPADYAYIRARLFDDYDAPGNVRKFRVCIHSTDRVETTPFIRLTNGPAWGSSEGDVNQYLGQDVPLNAENGYTGYVDIDYDDYATFYADQEMRRDGYVLIGYQGNDTGGDKTLSVYCLDLTDADDIHMDAGRVSALDQKVRSLTGQTDVLLEDVDQLKNGKSAFYITAWGDSLTSGGGWTTRIEELSGIPVYNGGTGGEQSTTIMARQGGDIMIVNDITIPAGTTPIVIADRDVDGGISTELGQTVTPLLQGGTHFNPCHIGDVEGTLAWTGSAHNDMTGDWTFTRSEAGDAVQITRPTAIRTNFDMTRNGGLQILFIGQNGGYDGDVDTLILQHRRMIEHSSAQHTLVVGLSSGTDASRADYEAAMRAEFGRYFVSLREYLTTPVYAEDGTTIVSCYGLEDAGLTATQADLDDIAVGKVPPQLLADAVHYTAATKTVIGDMLYRRMRDLGMF